MGTWRLVEGYLVGGDFPSFHAPHLLTRRTATRCKTLGSFHKSSSKLRFARRRPPM